MVVFMRDSYLCGAFLVAFGVVIRREAKEIAMN